MIFKAQLLKTYRRCRHWSYKQKQQSKKPVTVTLPNNKHFLLNPQGQIAEAVYVNRFERRERELAIKFLKPGMQVLDVGANIGLYALIAAKCVEHGGKIWAFEPASDTFRLFQNNIALNHESAISAYQMAVSDQPEGFLTLRRDPGAGDAMRYLLPKEAVLDLEKSETGDSGDIEQVPITSLDHFVAKNNVAKIDFLKMDVEGNEYAVFVGAEKLLSENEKIVIMFECSRDFSKIFQLLRDKGFGLYCRQGDQKVWNTDNETLIQAGNIWASRDKSLLPPL